MFLELPVQVCPTDTEVPGKGLDGPRRSLCLCGHDQIPQAASQRPALAASAPRLTARLAPLAGSISGVGDLVLVVKEHDIGSARDTTWASRATENAGGDDAVEE